MGSGRKWTTVTDPRGFPEPPRYLVWRNQTRVSIFESLSLVKAVVSQQAYDDTKLNYDYTVYEWDGAGWQEIYKIPKGSNKNDHPLWKDGAAPRHKQVISEDEVAAAIASITGQG